MTSFIEKMRSFSDEEENDFRKNVSIFGYYPYYSFRRSYFERQVKEIGLDKISRKRPDLTEAIKSISWFFKRNRTSNIAYLINGNDRIIDETESNVVLGYFSGQRADVNLEGIRAICHMIGYLSSVIAVMSYLRKLSFIERSRYIGDGIYYVIAKHLLSKIAAEQLILTVSYSHYPIIAAAKSLGIRTIELQHGAISKCHIGYCGNIERYFPDEFVPLNCTWSNYLSSRPLPLKFDSSAESWMSGAKKISFSELSSGKLGSRILVIGQETVHEHLYKFFEKLSSNERLTVSYRYHPRVKRTSLTLDEQTSAADVIIGSYSTVLVDCASAGKIIGVLPLLASEFLDVLSEKENVYVIEGI